MIFPRLLSRSIAFSRYPDGKTMRAAARVHKAANKLKPKRPQSAPLNKTA